MLTVSETLNRAADLIEERGWMTGEGWVYTDSATTEPLCLEGGIMAAQGMFVDREASDFKFLDLLACPAYIAVSDYLDRQHTSVRADGWGFEGQPLYWWNDEQQSAEPVIEVLRSCALIEAAKEQDAAWSTYAEMVTQ